MLNNTHEYLKYLMNQEKWTMEEKEWMLGYLEGEDLSALQAIAAASYNTDLASREEEGGSMDNRFSALVLEKIHQRIQAPHSSRVIRGRFYKITLAVAAIAAIIAGAGYFFHSPSRDRSADGRAIMPTDRIPGMVAGGATMCEAVTTIKQRRTLQLPDGTQVSLEQGSKMDYPSRFSGATREIYLSGEAFFEVKKEEAHPFIVHTRFQQITVLGTSFNVDTNGPDEESVVVVSGSVKVEVSGDGNTKQALVLSPNEKSSYYPLSNRLEKQQAFEDALFYQQRRNGSFIYNGTNVGKVLEDMQRFYHTRLVLEGDGLKCIFHGHFHTYDELDKALSLIAIPLNARVRKDTTTHTYIIYGGSCQ